MELRPPLPLSQTESFLHILHLPNNLYPIVDFIAVFLRPEVLLGGGGI